MICTPKVRHLGVHIIQQGVFSFTYVLLPYLTKMHCRDFKAVRQVAESEVRTLLKYKLNCWIQQNSEQLCNLIAWVIFAIT